MLLLLLLLLLICRYCSVFVFYIICMYAVAVRLVNGGGIPTQGLMEIQINET